MAKRPVRFKVWRGDPVMLGPTNRLGKYYAHLVAGNNEIVLSSEGYDAARSAHNACRAMWESLGASYVEAAQLALTNSEVEAVALANDFQRKEQEDGKQALNPKVFRFARAVLSAAKSSAKVPPVPYTQDSLRPGAAKGTK